jgi:endonuclease YncB( thermonuclease family)
MCGPALLLALAACEPASKTAVVDGEHVIVKGHKITLHQLDAPDSKHPKCDAEKAVADLTEERLGGLLMAARTVEFRKTGMACLQFMDCDGFVTADGVDVGDTLIGEGLAAKKPVEGGGEAPHDWCVERMPQPEPALPPEQTTAPPANPT